jgi:nucleoside-diphosphate-sugar epimerase
MNEVKTIFILGGTGFVGRAVTEKYLRNNWRVIVSTRAKNLEEAKNKLFLHGFDKNLFNNSLLFGFNVDLADEKWSQIDVWIQLLKRINVSPSSIIRVINLVGETSKSADKILKSNINTLESIFTLVRYIKNQNKNFLFINMGSIVEKRYGKKLSPYEYAKKIAYQKIEKSNLCDFHFVAHYIKGRGEQKMKSAAPILWNKLKFSHRWLFGFKVGVVDVDDLADVIYHFLEEVKIPLRRQKPIEVNVTNGELVFGDIIKNLLPENKRSIPEAIIPVRLEGIFLWFYSTIIPLVKPNDQFARRLANFAKRGLANYKTPKATEIFKTAEYIKKLVSDNNYEVLERSPNLIVLSQRLSVIYVLKEKNQEELEQVVQKALVV